MKFRNCVAYLMLVAGLLCGVGVGFAQTTAFTYQGRLTDNGAPASGTYDLRFTTYDALAAGNLVAGPLTNQLVTVTNGLFTVQLDFGNAFDGSDRWLELGVRPGGSNDIPFTALNPRQQVTPTPYALFAQSAGAVNGNSVVASNSTTLGGTIQFAGNSAAPGYVWVATDANGTGQWQPAPNASNFTNAQLYGLTRYLIPGQNQFTYYKTAYTNPIYAADWTFDNIVAPNSLGDPQDDNTWHWGFNRTGGGVPQNTNAPSFVQSFESAWQNYPGLTQSEWWWGWSSPNTQWGTNFSWRPFGMDFYWDTTTKEFRGSDMSWNVGSINIGNPLQSSYPITFGTSSTEKKGTMEIYGSITTHTNGADLGGISIIGGSLNIVDTGTNYTSIFQSPPGNLNGLVMSSAYPAQNLTIRGFGQMTLNQTAVLQPLGVTTNVPLLLQGYNGQSTNLLEVRDYAYNLKAAIDQNGNLFASGISGISGLVTNNYPGAAFTTPFSLNSPNHNNIVQFFSNDDGKVFEDFNGYLRIGGNGYLMLKSGSSAVFNGPTGSTYFGQEIYGGNFFEINNEVNSVMRIRGFSKVMPVTPLHINGGFGDMASNAVALTVTAPVNASADLQQWQSSGGSTLARVDNQGNGYFRNFRAGVVNIADLDTNVVVTFSSPLSSTNYSVVVTPEFNTGGATWWVDTKTTNGFNFNLSAGVAGGGNVSWQAVLGQ